MRAKLTTILAIFGLYSGLASAVPSAVVDTVQAPAWLQRGERQMPLAPGMVLENRDRLRTGPGARAIVRLADGSAVKFGAGADVAVNALQADIPEAARHGRDSPLFSAALDVVKGAFRFTTGVFRAHTSRRAVDVRSGVLTIGIRGTDLWGSSNEQRDLVCLIEGRISVQHPAVPAVELNEPRHFYVANKGSLPNAVGHVDPAQLSEWAKETEPRPDGASLQADGPWSVEFEQLDQAAVLALYEQLSGAGYAVRIRAERRGDALRYGLYLPDLVSAADAQRMAGQFAGLLQEMSLPGQPQARPAR